MIPDTPSHLYTRISGVKGDQLGHFEQLIRFVRYRGVRINSSNYGCPQCNQELEGEVPRYEWIASWSHAYI